MNRRRFVSLATIMGVAACRSENILRACAQSTSTASFVPSVSPALRDVYISDGFSGVQSGTKSNPYSVSSTAEFDALCRSLSADDYLHIHLLGANNGFSTRGAYEFGTYAFAGWRMGKYWQIDGGGSILRLDPDLTQIDSAPLHTLLTREQTVFPETNDMTPQQVWDGLPVGQAIRDLTIDRQYTKFADAWKAKDCQFKGGSVLQGHNAAYENVRFTNHGALKNSTGLSSESFPANIVGAMGAPDRDKIARLDPATHIFDATGEPSHITGCTFDGYDPASTDDQVTVFMITGNIGEPGGWNTGNYVQHFRRYAYQRNNVTIATGKNLVQPHTIYQALGGDIRFNTSDGAYVGYYGDFYSTQKLAIDTNKFRNTYQGVRIVLSPTGPNPQDFYHRGYVIGPNEISSSDCDVYLDTLGIPTATRYIRDMLVDSSLSLREVGATNTQRTSCS